MSPARPQQERDIKPVEESFASPIIPRHRLNAAYVKTPSVVREPHRILIASLGSGSRTRSQ